MSFSIITTVLNEENFISDCIESVQRQKYSKNIEHIIIDGGSKDNTVNLIKDFADKYQSINFFQKNNIGIYQGINFGLSMAKNDFIGILNSDDFYVDEMVFENLNYIFEKNPDIPALHSNVKIFNRKNINKIYRIYKSKEFSSDDFFKCDTPPHTSLFIKKEVYEKFGKFNEDLKIASDFEFMLRVFGKNKVKNKFVDKTFVCMRSHGVSTKNVINIIKSNYEVIKSFKMNDLKINYLYLIMKVIKKFKQIRL